MLVLNLFEIGGGSVKYHVSHLYAHNIHLLWAIAFGAIAQMGGWRLFWELSDQQSVRLQVRILDQRELTIYPPHVISGMSVGLPVTRSWKLTKIASPTVGRNDELVL
jgi:hypothetical protein